MQEITKDLTEYRLSLKEKILELAMSEFEKKGVRAVKMDDIATALSISKRTLYEIYGDKESLLYEGICRRDKIRREHLSDYSTQGHNVIEILLEAYLFINNASRDVNPQFYDDLHRYPKVEQYMRKIRMEKRSDFMMFMKMGVDDGCFSADVNYQLIILLFESLSDYAMQNKLLFKYSSKELFYHFLLIPLRGFCTEKGLEMIRKIWKQR